MAKQEEEYVLDEEEEEEEGEDGSFRRWGIIIGVGVGVVCLGLIMVLWFGRDVFLSPLAKLNATNTLPATNTVLPSATLTLAQPTDLPTITPTFAATPTTMRLPAMEIMSLVSGPPVMDEKFDDNSRNWTGLGDSADFTVQEGNLIERSTQPGKPALVYCSGTCGPYKDYYYYEAEIVDERASEFGYGLVFAINGQKNSYYEFKIRPKTSEYGLFKVQNGQSTPLIDWTSSPAVLPAPQINVLGASFQEKNIDLYLNGTRINSYSDKNPFTEGQIGFTVDQDGVRLMVNRAVVYELIPRTPGAPGQGQPPVVAGTLQPGATATKGLFTATPTRSGNCPSYVPDGEWLLVVTLSSTTGSNRSKQLTINGISYTLKELNTAFYLLLNTNYNVEAAGKTYSFYQTICKVVYIRAK